MKAMAFAAPAATKLQAPWLVSTAPPAPAKAALLASSKRFSMSRSSAWELLQQRHWAEVDAKVVSGMHHRAGTGSAFRLRSGGHPNGEVSEVVVGVYRRHRHSRVRVPTDW